MADNELFTDDKLDLLPLLSKERTQRFELLLHLIPNLKQHIILCGQSGIGKTLLLDKLYDINSDVWECCFVQGNAELSFETIQAQLTKTMQRNKHVSLDSALQDFKEQHKKIVLIIDDAGLLVSGLMTTLIEYAATLPIKIIFSLTPEAKQAHRNTDKALNDCYVLEVPPLSKSQCAYFLRYLAAKPRTYGAIPIDEKLVEKIYAETNGVPAKIINDFNKLSRKSENDYSKWIAGFIGITVLAIGINQGVRYFKKDEPIATEETPVIPTPAIQTEKIEPAKPVEQATTPEKTEKPELDIVIPEFKLDIEKGAIPAQTHSTETVQPAEKPAETTENLPAIEPEKAVEKPQEQPKQEEPKAEPEKTVAPVAEPVKPEPEKTTSPVVKIPEPVKPQIEPPKIVAPQIAPLVKPITPEIAFPKIQPAKGVKIQALPEKNAIHEEPIPAPVVKEVKPQAAKVVETKVEKPAEEKSVEEKTELKNAPEEKAVVKTESAKKEPEKKIESKSEKEKPAVKEKKAEEKKKPEKEKAPEKAVEKTPEKEQQAVIKPSAGGRYSLQLITLSSEAAVENFKKKHAALGDNIRVVKSGTEEKPRFGLMYGGFANAQDAEQAKQKLPAEFATALPRKSN